MPAGTVLVVDGDWRMRKLIRTNLEAQGLQVAEAGSGQECLERQREMPWDLMVLNADLPDANGWRIVRGWRQGEGGTQVPIIVIGPEPASRRLLQRCPGVTQLLTPFAARALLACVGRALAQGEANARC